MYLTQLMEREIGPEEWEQIIILYDTYNSNVVIMTRRRPNKGTS